MKLKRKKDSFQKRNSVLYEQQSFITRKKKKKKPVTLDYTQFLLNYFLQVEVKLYKSSWLPLSFTSYSDVYHHTTLATPTSINEMHSSREA